MSRVQNPRVHHAVVQRLLGRPKTQAPGLEHDDPSPGFVPKED